MATSAKKQWADGPFELISSSVLGYQPGEKIKPIHECAEEMIIIHNVLLRGINSIYHQCTTIESLPNAKAVIADFAHYALQWGEVIEEHHHNEEAIFFPELAKVVGKPELMGAEIAQHHAFHDGLAGYIAYLKGVVDGKETYDGSKLRGIIDALMPPLREHLMHEVNTLKGFDQYDEKTQQELVVTNKRITEQIKSDGQKNPETKYTLVPFVLMHHDVTFENGVHHHFPGIPWFPMLIITWIFVPKHKGWWQFAPCGTDMKPRELKYVK